MKTTTQKVYEEVLRIAESEPEFVAPPCTCPHYERCDHMIYDINMKPRCYYRGSLGSVKK